MKGHVLTVFNAVDVPDSVQRAVLEMLAQHKPDIYERECDAAGMTT